MNKRIAEINKELEKLGMGLVALKGRRKNGVSQKNFKIASNRSYSTMGSDGEPYYYAYYSMHFSLDSMKDLSLKKVEELVLAKEGKDLAKIAAETASKISADDAEAAKRRAVYDAERAKEQAAKAEAMEPCSQQEYERNLGDMLARLTQSEESKLEWYNLSECKNMLVSNDYRTEFLSLIANPKVFDMATDLIKLKAPKTLMADYEMTLRINDEANRRGIQRRSIGAVTSAIRYLVGVEAHNPMDDFNYVGSRHHY
jgi:hypothetical protein